MGSARFSADDHDPHAEIERLADIAAEREALEMRLAGMSYREIGIVQSVDASTANRRVNAGIIAHVPVELQDQVRAIELERIGVLYRRAILTLASECTTEHEKERAEDMMLKCHDRIVALTGATAPKEVHVYNHDQLDAEIDALLSRVAEPVAPAPDVAPPEQVYERATPPNLHGRWSGRARRGEHERDDDLDDE